MNTQLLTDLGLSLNEARVYLTLLDTKQATITKIAKHAGIDRRNAYDTIDRLLTKGLAYRVLPKKNLTYAPMHPSQLREMIQERMQDLEESMPALVKKFEITNPDQQVMVYRGVQGLKNYIKLVIQTKQPIYGFGSKGSWFDPRIKNFATRSDKQFKEHNIQVKIIYDYEIKKYPEVVDIIGGKHKFLPKKYSSESSFETFGDYVAIYSGMVPKGFKDDISIFIVKDKSLAQDYTTWFELVWDLLSS